VAIGDIPANAGFARADIDHVVIGRRNRDGAYGSDRLPVKHRLPVHAGIGALPHAARYSAKIENVRLAWHSGHGQYATATEWSNRAPAHRAKNFFIDESGWSRRLRLCCLLSRWRFGRLAGCRRLRPLVF